MYILNRYLQKASFICCINKGIIHTFFSIFKIYFFIYANPCNINIFRCFYNKIAILSSKVNLFERFTESVKIFFLLIKYFS